MLCLPWDSFLVSNDCPKLEQTFDSRQDGAVENPELWRKILHGRHVKGGGRLIAAEMIDNAELPQLADPAFAL